MKQTKWLISLSACLFLMAASSAGVKGKLAIRVKRGNRGVLIRSAPFPHLFDREGGRFDPVALFAAILL